MTDIRRSLLRRDALSAAKEVLYHLDIHFSNQLQNTAAPVVDNGSVELVEEFVFNMSKDRSVQRKMTSLQELQLLEITCSYFQEQGKDSLRQIIFSALFSPQCNVADDRRMAMLGKLVSMAVAVCRVPVLECAASWLQRSPAPHCMRLATVLVDDYCSSAPSPAHALRDIVSVSPRFCCQFITAVTAVYDLSTDDLIPSSDLLEMVVTWVHDNPRLTLLTFLGAPIPSSRPPGALDPTPLLGLVRWCIKSPLAYKRHRKPLQAPDSGAAHALGPAEGGRDPRSLYSMLHLSVLQILVSLRADLTELQLYGRVGVMSLEHVAKLVGELAYLVDELNPGDSTAETELSLNRLAQALQVAMAGGALLCSREDLRCLCSRLPYNSLLQLVKSGPFLPASHPGFQQETYPPVHTPVQDCPSQPVSNPRV
ncbi:integrator complex subunit 15-like isoform X2 [Conger conger]|uniref:integrator complex subunit 15-like isoform X2 n=1 Tax=Conger conger TaxID=82655 RepID=UPI002A5A34FA|nr:integrator complex subunit 15-like isoform X2 [Conger conger]